MTIQVKSGGSYADVAGVFVKRGGAYSAADVYAKVSGVYVGVGGSGVPTGALFIDGYPVLIDGQYVVFN